MSNNNLASCGLTKCMFLGNRLCSMQQDNNRLFQKLEMVFCDVCAALSLLLAVVKMVFRYPCGVELTKECLLWVSSNYAVCTQLAVVVCACERITIFAFVHGCF